MNESIPEFETLRRVPEQFRHLVVSQGQDTFKKINSKEARRQADRLELPEKAEKSFFAFESALEAFPELLAQNEGTADVEPPTAFREVKSESVISQESLDQRVTIPSSVGNTIGYWECRRFTIEANSQMRIDETPSIHEWLKVHRASILARGVVLKQEAGCLFVKNAVLTSASAAADVVLGRSGNSPQEWKLPNGSPLGKMTPKELG